jgi:AraC family transcriptional regulator
MNTFHSCYDEDKGGHVMDLLKNINGALKYIEENLTEEIDFKEVARRALCSEYHFKRMFSFLAGISLSEYIRRRRLTLAAFDLRDSSLKVIDIAVKYGYNSPDSFARAFQNFHGITPSEARINGHSLKAFPPMTFQLSIKGGNEMNYRIVEKEAFHIVGIMKRVPIVFNGVNPDIAAMWQSLNMDTIHQLKSLSNVEPLGLLSASTHFSEGRMEEKGELDHYIGVATTNECPENLTKLVVPASTWAVFEAVGPFPETLQDVWGRIYSEWFPSSNYEQMAGPEILWNEHKDMSSPTFRSEIWIPVLKR